MSLRFSGSLANESIRAPLCWLFVLCPSFSVACCRLTLDFDMGLQRQRRQNAPASLIVRASLPLPRFLLYAPRFFFFPLRKPLLHLLRSLRHLYIFRSSIRYFRPPILEARPVFRRISRSYKFRPALLLSVFHFQISMFFFVLHFLFFYFESHFSFCSSIPA